MYSYLRYHLLVKAFQLRESSTFHIKQHKYLNYASRRTRRESLIDTVSQRLVILKYQSKIVSEMTINKAAHC